MCKDDVTKLVQSYFPSADEAAIQELTENILDRVQEFAACGPARTNGFPRLQQPINESGH